MKTIRYISLMAIAGCLLSSCDMNEENYTSTTPEIFATTPEKVDALVACAFVDRTVFLINERWYAQEYSTDEMICPTKTSGDWYDGGSYARMHYHQWTTNESIIRSTYNGVMQGVSRTNEALTFLQRIDLEKIGLDEKYIEETQAQLHSLLGWFYMRGLDYFGGLPLYKGDDHGMRPRATARETFNFIEELFKEGIEKLPVKKAGDAQNGFLTKGAAAAMLAQLYFNAVPYIGEERFSDAETLCRDIINGKYGPYEIDPDWHGIFGFDNDKSPEMIWTAPSEYNHPKYGQFSWWWQRSMPKNCRVYFDNTYVAAGQNGFCLAPSKNPMGKLYTLENPEIKLGGPYGKLHRKDLRKENYRYKGNKQYVGMFLAGPLAGPTGEPVMGNKEDLGKQVNLIDQMYQYTKYPKPDANTPSTILAVDESCGIRLVKFPIPDDADKTLTWNADFPGIRLAEVYYMLAECRLRAGQPKEAAELINKVRSRYFEVRDGNPAPDTMDMYRMADEWMIEFLGEGRRRTDLIRMGYFVHEPWWDHTPSHDENLNRYPIPHNALSANNLLKQNPGYDDEGNGILAPEER
ncbi:MAG: RagB/SusD family nutrient uptake outer membrane protein [Muribaculaceae bacterium]|jgi:hypothetical protein|uniref:RagB/SusD family nutrient uptake outer membrane protein n=1 Tax=Sangeribacter muris TaxID=2880703 RepID=UPI000E97746D|nr:RagB/SusD family nutrient uptake outer membrane protein [Sangeribacter muris]MBJ2191957.1 RagB/SusD family nutrient uptake outer membrane protein [Muribaculaceae bacterium]HBY16769.1 RagB/SusD family nutrient uptake outer membrane protein [Porphyromonadaceae bacterium]MBJ2196518.1 RagB/SusD family nutrient uptake outer membrane protein [Muribaculaceae bacterium]MCI9029670.1 RagB/SusD family nutrient uptake outer membrane protein [Muribaculaceae bacterium]MCX4280500.1 RagB/SusD family nutrie